MRASFHLLLAVMCVGCLQPFLYAQQVSYTIPGVVDYDQEMFPIDQEYTGSYSEFISSDLLDLASFAAKLTQPPEAVSAFLYSRLSPDTLTALANYQGPDSNPLPLKASFAVDLNKVIHGASIYDAQRFAGVPLRPDTTRLLAGNPQGDALLLLNRLLLEDAYPQEISRSHTFGVEDRLNYEIGDCHPIACAIINGYYDGANWPRLIPFGTHAVARGATPGFRPYSGNAWGVDTVVRRYKQALHYSKETGVNVGLDWWFWDYQGRAVKEVVEFMDSQANVTATFHQGGILARWEALKDALRHNHPLAVAVGVASGEGLRVEFTDGRRPETINPGTGHAVCGIGYSEIETGRWLVAKMGWGLAADGKLNVDSSEVHQWHVSEIALSGVASTDDDDGLEDGDTIWDAHEIKRAEVYRNLRCRDSLINSTDFALSYGDWFKITNAEPGKTLDVTIRFRNADGNLDLRLYDSNRKPVGLSALETDSERITVPSAQSTIYYVFVYGRGNVQNDDYTLAVAPIPLRVAPAKPSYERYYGFGPVEYPVKYEMSDFLPGDGPDTLEIPPRVFDPGPGPCAAAKDHPLTPSGGTNWLYSFVPSNSVLHVLPKGLIIRAAPASRTEGNTNPVFRAEFDGLVETCNSEADFEVSFTCSADTNSPPGPYEIVPRLVRGNPNYAITLSTGTLTVQPKNENLAWLTDTGAAFPRAAVDGQGTVHVVCTEKGRVLYRQSTATGEPRTSVMEVFTKAHSPDIAVGEDGQAHVVALTSDGTSVLYARLGPGGAVLARNAFGPRFTVDSAFILSSVRVALDNSSGDGHVVVGVINSTYQWTTTYYDPTPLPGYSMGEVNAYLNILAIQSGLAIPRVKPGGEWVLYYRLNEAGDDVRRGAVYGKYADVAFPDTVRDLSLAVDDAGKTHFAWKETKEGKAGIVWKTDQESLDTSPQWLAQTTGPLSPPELSTRTGIVAVAWAEYRRLKLAELQPALRVIETTAEVDLRHRVGLAPAGSAWRIAWVDDGSSRLADVVLGWNERGIGVIAEPKIRVSVSTAAPAGVASRLTMPTLASRQGVWALVFAAARTNLLDVAIYTHQSYGGVFGLTSGSGLWDRSDFTPLGSDTFVPIRCERDLLSRQQGNCQPVEGVVADGVTPLLFRLGGIPTEELRLVLSPESAEAQPAVALLEQRLSVASSFDPSGRGIWRTGLVHRFEPITQDEELYVKLDGVSLDKLSELGVVWPPPGTEQQLAFKLGLYRNQPGEPNPQDRIATIPFVIRKPPVILVHGYNADASSWSEVFRDILSKSAGVAEAVVPINYGTKYHDGAPAEKSGYYLNTLLDLKELRDILSEELTTQEDRFRRRWAMTRYDVVGHSQGGVLLRMLCADEFNTEAGFINERNFGRGRFRRVITIGSPHNGSRLAHYLSTLKHKIEERSRQGEWGLGSDQLFKVLDWQAPNVLQDKFDPFLTTSEGYIRQVNLTIRPHSKAKAHLISSVIDHTRRIRPSALFWLFGLTTDERLETVLPKGAQGLEWGTLIPRSDGVVDLQSHFGGVANPDQISKISVAVAHAEPRLYGTEHAQGGSPAIAQVITNLLHGVDSARHFGAFVKPEPLGPEVQTAIDQIAEDAAREAVEVAEFAELVVSMLSPTPGWLRFVATLNTLTGEAPQPAVARAASKEEPSDEPMWMVRVYSPDPMAEQSVTWERSTTVAGGVEVHIPEGLIAQVVLFGLASGPAGELWSSRPTLIYDTLSDHIHSLVIAGVPPTVGRNAQLQAGELARLHDGGISEFYLPEPQMLRWGGTDSNLVSVTAGGKVTTHDRLGQAEITVQYGEWVGSQTLEVVNQMPEVAVAEPRDRAELSSGELVTVQVAASDADGEIEKVVLYINDQSVQEWSQPPYTWVWTGRSPGDYVLRAAVYDDSGGMRGSLPVRVTAVPQAPTCVWIAPEADVWYSGALRLEGLVSDPDMGDTASVVFEYSVNSSDGRDGEWIACGPAVEGTPHIIVW